MLHLLWGSLLLATVLIVERRSSDSLSPEEKAILLSLWEKETCLGLRYNDEEKQRGLYDDEVVEKLINYGMHWDSSYPSAGFYFGIACEGEQVPPGAIEALYLSAAIESLVETRKIAVSWRQGTTVRKFRLYCELTDEGRKSLKRYCQNDRPLSLS